LPMSSGDDVTLTREQLLAWRWRAQGLDRSARADDVRDLDLWALGVQDSPAGSAALSLAARVRGGLDAVPDLADGRRFTTVWGTRGAPLVLRNGDVAAFAAAIWPVDDADAVSRLSGNGQQLRKSGVDSVEAIRVTAGVMARAVSGEMTKGEVSAEISPKLPDDYITWCRGCQAHHLGDQLMRVAGLPAGLKLVPGASPATLAPIARWKGAPAASAMGDLVDAHLRLYGPSTPGDVAAFLQATAAAVKSVWPDDLVPVTVEGKRRFARPDDADGLADAPEPEGVRLLPRSDAWLLARDRHLTVPGAADRKTLWPVIGWPGAIVADGEVVASWRAKAVRSGQGVAVSVEPFTSLPKPVRSAIEVEAEGVATQRGVDDLSVTFT
ncbi:MAG TPA: crosslink repair DNA glycosylase YcaQ family protein, partial [Acidimicrobiales bacterium]